MNIYDFIFFFIFIENFPSLIYAKTCSSKLYGMLSSNHENAKKKHKMNFILSTSTCLVVNFIFIKYQTDLTLTRTKNVNIMDNIRVFMCVLLPSICFANKGAKNDKNSAANARGKQGICMKMFS